MNELAPKSNLDITREAMATPAQRQVDKMVDACKQMPQVDCPLVHRFTPGLYTREIFMPAGTLIVSKIHMTEHPYVITKGKVAVWVEGKGVEVYGAGHVGITKPGTRRVLYIKEDCSWLTFHATDKTTHEEVEKDIIYTPENDQITITSEQMNMLKEAN